MSDLFKVRVGGPLAGFREALISEFLRFGFAESTAARHLQLMAHLSDWMEADGVGAEGLTWADIERFCSDHGLRGRHRYCPGAAPRSMLILMAVVHPEAAADGAAVGGAGLPAAVEALLGGFVVYLRGERALAEKTIDGYADQVRAFCRWYVVRHGAQVAAVTADVVNEYVTDRLGVWSVHSVRAARTAVRGLLRWLFLSGRVGSDVSGGVMAVRHHLHDEPPRALPAADVAALLAVRMSARDRALVLVLLRLGLRSSEAAGLSVDDFDWRGGTVTVRGKGGEAQRMPVPEDVGQAIAAYLIHSRGDGCPHRALFLAAHPPFGPMSGHSLSVVVTLLARRAGLPGRVGSHRLRHTAATGVLAGGGTLAEVGQLLRHRSVTATVVYARVDFGSLALIARPWPAGSQR